MPKAITVSDIHPGNPGPAGWNAILDPPAPARVLSESLKADWLVIGGGFAGLAAAQRLVNHHPDDKVVLLEAIRVGDGSAGRNSGFMIDLPHDISKDHYEGALEHDKEQTKMNRAALAFAEEAALAYGFSREVFDKRGKINAAASPKGDAHNRAYVEHLNAMGEASTWLTREEIQRITGTDYYISGLHTPGCTIIQPAGFVRGFAQGLASKIDLFEDSPVVGLQWHNDHWEVKTPQGAVHAPKVILAVNGHLRSFGFLRGRLMHIFLYASMTRALTDEEIAQLGGEPYWDVVPSHPMGSTVRRISGMGGDRIVVRNTFEYRAYVRAKESAVHAAARAHDRSFKVRFPMLPEVEMAYRWGGRLCLSWNGVPVFGELEKGLFAACCQNGLGASKGILSGMLAADYASGVDHPYITNYLAQSQPRYLPPEPFASIGANAYLNLKERQAGLEK